MRTTSKTTTILSAQAHASLLVSQDNSDHAFAETTLQSVLERYDGFGIKRSGGPGDRHVTDWLDAELTGLGYRTQRQTFETPFMQQEAGLLTVDDVSFPALPQEPTSFNMAPGRIAPLCIYDPQTDKRAFANRHVVIKLPWARHSAMNAALQQILSELASAGAAGVMLVTCGPSQEAVSLNVPLSMRLGALHIVTLRESSSHLLLEAARHGKEARLLVTGRRGQRTTCNLSAERPGGARTVVISTPRNGWHHCTGERGPGIAIFLALAAELAVRAGNRRVLLLATGGHEYENLGAEYALRTLAPDRDAVDLWIHLGAGLGARDFHDTPGGLVPLPSADAQRFLAATPSLLSDARHAFAGVPGLEAVYPSKADAPGETGAIIRAGYPNVAGAFCAHRFHHSVADRLDKTSGEMVRPVALAFRDLCRRVLGT